jgi:hypothetical protein
MPIAFPKQLPTVEAPGDGGVVGTGRPMPERGAKWEIQLSLFLQDRKSRDRELGTPHGVPLHLDRPANAIGTGGKGRNVLGIPLVFCYYTCAIECEQDAMATFLRRPCLFVTMWIAGSQRPAIARAVVSGPCVMYTGRARSQTYRGTDSRRGGFSVRTGSRASRRKAETRPFALGSARLAARATREGARRQSTLVDFRNRGGWRQGRLLHENPRIHMNRRARA